MRSFTGFNNREGLCRKWFLSLLFPNCVGSVSCGSEKVQCKKNIFVMRVRTMFLQGERRNLVQVDELIHIAELCTCERKEKRDELIHIVKTSFALFE